MPFAPQVPLPFLLEIQSGVVSREQAIDAGMSHNAIDNKLRSARWQALQRGVYATFTGTPVRAAQLWAVALRAGPNAALSFHTAAELYGLAPPKRLVHVTVPVGHNTGQIRDAAVHYSRHIEERTHHAYSPPRTRVEDTVLDLAQVSANLDEAFDWLCRAVGRRITTTHLVREALARRARVRWRADLEVALDDIAEGARSVLERRYINGVERRHGLPTARRQAKTVIDGQTRYVDNLYEEASVAVELDGSASHPPEQRWADSRRDNAHAGLGILTIRYNWADVTQRPCFVAAQVAGLLRARGMPVSPRPCGPACEIAARA
ncbi:MAG TPA: type IV toxin-antitoxin system AbiEi family antitoxin domain-containing protein [Streptosporangiaceae bacterium]|jgi:very-short-patch-repair endonuclease